MKLRARKAAVVVTGISFESKTLLRRAKRRAKARRRSLSAHLCDLVHADLQKPAAASPVNPANHVRVSPEGAQ